jgi:hypothetical protein
MVSILNYLPQNRIFENASNVNSVMFRVFNSFNRHLLELHTYIREAVYSFIPSNGYVFLDLWASVLDINNFGYFIDNSFAGKIKNVYSRFYLSKTQTLDGLYNYLTAVGYPMSAQYGITANTFPLVFPYRFEIANLSVNGITIIKGTEYAGGVYPNSVFDTEEDAKNTLLVAFPDDIEVTLIPKFKYCLEEVLNLAIKIMYINDTIAGIPFGYRSEGDAFSGIIAGYSDDTGSTTGGVFE